MNDDKLLKCCVRNGGCVNLNKAMDSCLSFHKVIDSTLFLWLRFN